MRGREFYAALRWAPTRENFERLELILSLILMRAEPTDLEGVREGARADEEAEIAGLRAQRMARKAAPEPDTVAASPDTVAEVCPEPDTVPGVCPKPHTVVEVPPEPDEVPEVALGQRGSFRVLGALPTLGQEA
jgi:hypothetical protein